MIEVCSHRLVNQDAIFASVVNRMIEDLDKYVTKHGGFEKLSHNQQRHVDTRNKMIEHLISYRNEVNELISLLIVHEENQRQEIKRLKFQMDQPACKPHMIKDDYLRQYYNRVHNPVAEHIKSNSVNERA